MSKENSESVVVVPQPAASNGHAPFSATPSGANGSSPATHAQLPKSRKRGSKTLRVLIPAGGGVFSLGLVAVVWFVGFHGPQTHADLVTVRVEARDLQLKIVERGALEAKENHDIKCEVKAGSRGAPKIKWVVDNGAYVKKGDLLVDIDDSYIVEQMQAKKIERDNAEATKIAAEQTHPVKKIAIALAEQQAQKWIKGDFPQQLHDLEGQIQIAESTVLQQEDRTAWVGRMVKKQYMTASQQQAEEATLTGNRLTLQKLQEQKKVLIEYTDPVTRQTNENAIKQAKVDERTAYANMESTRAVFAQQDGLLKDLEDQVKQCKVYAPGAGIVVYAVPEQTRMGSGATQSIIAQGEPVQYGQKMMSIPDLAHMLVNVRIHEAFINHMVEGLPVTVRVDAVPGKAMKAHVRAVANVASPQDWLSPDVKVYQAYVEIDELVQQYKLKPGLSAVCTIFTDSRVEHVLAVPIQAVVSPLEKNGKPRCFVMTPDGPKAREVEVGLTDEKYIEIKSGLNENEEVVLNPRALVNEKERKASKEDEKALSGAAKQLNGAGGQGRSKPSGSPGGQPVLQK
jgi:multidrug resistance efflux pump